MIDFGDISLETFLKDYWQKKPLLIKQGLKHFQTLISSDELAGLALDPDIESRLVHAAEPNDWQLSKGPFSEEQLTQLPSTPWTLLIQGVDRLLPEIAELVQHFDFIPRWRFDDVMISTANKGGGVGPHYDHYDVFLLQAHGSREWQLTAKQCVPENIIPNTALRLMQTFETEQTYILEPGDILYVPPFVGHHGTALTDDCITYSFGYRSYQDQEMLQHFTDFIGEQKHDGIYRDPTWPSVSAIGACPEDAVDAARNRFQTLLNDQALFHHWFGEFVTQLDESAEALLPLPRDDIEEVSVQDCLAELEASTSFTRDHIVRIAAMDFEGQCYCFINGILWETDGVSQDLIKFVANHIELPHTELKPLMQHDRDLQFVCDLWRLNWLC